MCSFLCGPAAAQQGPGFMSEGGLKPGLKGRLTFAIANAPADNELKQDLAKKLQPVLSSSSRHKMLLLSLQSTLKGKGVVEYEGQPDLLVHDLLFLRQRLNVGAATMGITESRIFWTVNTPHFEPERLPPNVGRALGTMLKEGGAKPGTPMLHGREDSSCCERLMCPLFRAFELKLLEDDEDGGGLIIERPMVCEPCQCWPVCFSQSQRVLVKDLDGRLLGQAIEPSPLLCGYHTSARNAAALGGSAANGSARALDTALGWAPQFCCTRVYVAQDAKGESLYILKANMCRDNCCAPGCCNESFDVEMYDWATGEYVGMSAFLWPLMTCLCMQVLIAARPPARYVRLPMAGLQLWRRHRPLAARGAHAAQGHAHAPRRAPRGDAPYRVHGR